MQRQRKLFLARSVLVLAVPAAIIGYETGPDAGYCGVPGEGASCIASGCHSGTLNASGGSVRVAFPNGLTYTPGVKQRLVVTVSDQSPTQAAWGFQLTARLAGGPQAQAGTFASSDNLTGLECASASNIANQSPVLVLPDQSCPAGMTLQYMEHSAAGYQSTLGQPGFAAYEFDWTPPATAAGDIVVYVAGNSGSGGPPTKNGVHVYTASYTLTPAPAAPLPVITSVENGASYQPGIGAGSWVTIKGTNLANTDPGRTWRGDEIVRGTLPVSLDGVSVRIDDKPAVVYFISKGQINVQAPDDGAQGPVRVEVNNNGAVSVAASADMQAYSPAFFQWGATRYAITTRYPDNALIGNPQSVPGTVAAKPGDVLILWGTGFGPTAPATPAGHVVETGTAVANAPTVTVGATPVAVIGAALSPGSAGLYQVAIQLPDSIATGDQPVVAGVAGYRSPATTSLFIAK